MDAPPTSLDNLSHCSAVWRRKTLSFFIPRQKILQSHLTVTVNPPAMHLLENLLLGIPESHPNHPDSISLFREDSILIYSIFSPKLLPGETEAPSRQWDSSSQVLPSLPLPCSPGNWGISEFVPHWCQRWQEHTLCLQSAGITFPPVTILEGCRVALSKSACSTRCWAATGRLRLCQPGTGQGLGSAVERWAHHSCSGGCFSAQSPPAVLRVCRKAWRTCQGTLPAQGIEHSPAPKAKPLLGAAAFGRQQGCIPLDPGIWCECSYSWQSVQEFHKTHNLQIFGTWPAFHQSTGTTEHVPSLMWQRLVCIACWLPAPFSILKYCYSIYVFPNFWNSFGLPRFITNWQAGIRKLLCQFVLNKQVPPLLLKFQKTLKCYLGFNTLPGYQSKGRYSKRISSSFSTNTGKKCFTSLHCYQQSVGFNLSQQYKHRWWNSFCFTDTKIFLTAPSYICCAFSVIFSFPYQLPTFKNTDFTATGPYLQPLFWKLLIVEPI